MSTTSHDHVAHRRAILLAVVVTVLWSSSWILVRWAIEDHGMTPLLGAGIRYLLGGLVLVAVVAALPAERSQPARLDRRQLAGLAILGLMFITVTQGAQMIALVSQPAATTSLVLAATPLLVALVSRALLGEPPTAVQVAATIAIVVGAALYLSDGLGATLVGMLAAAVALIANVVSALLGRAVNRSSRVSPRVVTTISMLIGAVTLVAIAWVVEGPPHLDPTGWAIIVWMAVVNTAMAFTWWNESLRHLSATESAAINNLMLLQIAALAWVFLGEAPAPVQWLGMIIVTVGVIGAQVWRRPGRVTLPARSAD
ncbi:MAG: EamA family transporter [Chloroflexi bacterium]|nr:EamA family transporter [Chloroflexota bacterium]